MKLITGLLLTLMIVSCGPRRKGNEGDSGKRGLKGSNGAAAIATGIDMQSSLVCVAGGLTLSTFQDLDNNGQLDSGEPVLQVKTVCNGTNGADGNDGISDYVELTQLSVNNADCPTGGVKIKSTSSANVQYICNGANGLNGLDGSDGQDGAQGEQGLQGIAGANGTSVVPVKFCNTDNSTYPEYGLMIGTELFAVNWGPTPASPNANQAFLTKIIAGTYMSTGGNNCHFTIQ